MEIVVCVFLIGTLLCEIALLIAIFRVIRILSGLSFPWHLLEKVADAWEKRPEVSRGLAPSTHKTSGRGSVPAVDELPPEIVAPNLKRGIKSAGFGSNTGNTDSDTQLHQGNQSPTGSKGSQPSSNDSSNTSSSSPTEGETEASLEQAVRDRSKQTKPG